eukprot:TRINITY_DN45841_c0_g1_i1.p1 TRINITY_DN45841_c0_g1~~TRINITY_DN45841_c0_g1_i1.p1  ORF type:complete len:268 (+),score=13.75 TRINITY_DN45841_c0_g1_i1:146-949(+)
MLEESTASQLRLAGPSESLPAPPRGVCHLLMTCSCRDFAQPTEPPTTLPTHNPVLPPRKAPIGIERPRVNTAGMTPTAAPTLPPMTQPAAPPPAPPTAVDFTTSQHRSSQAASRTKWPASKIFQLLLQDVHELLYAANRLPQTSEFVTPFALKFLAALVQVRFAALELSIVFFLLGLKLLILTFATLSAATPLRFYFSQDLYSLLHSLIDRTSTLHVALATHIRKAVVPLLSLVPNHHTTAQYLFLPPRRLRWHRFVPLPLENPPPP